MSHPRPTVLVVEDEVLVRMSIADHLEDKGFKVLEAANADEALAILNENLEIRLVFTDVDMPGSMDGLKLATLVRDRWPPLRIVITSGHRDLSATELPQGAQFFAKPYNADRIVETFRTLIA